MVISKSLSKSNSYCAMLHDVVYMSVEGEQENCLSSILNMIVIYLNVAVQLLYIVLS